MRIIAGDKRGILLKTLDGEETRPTMERVKEGVFSSLHFLLPGATVLDLYAGSGQMGFEALSRGAVRCTLVDSSRDAVAVIKENARATALYEKCNVACMDVLAFLANSREKFDVIFADPPYRTGAVPALLQQIESVAAPGAQVVCETEKQAELPQQVGGLTLQKTYRYGTVLISRYRMQEE
ncbi:MAG: 16S rRNA (guanine(966)-N(2))-methyltransferase RsmD [Oscillospiraceae bacterium]